MCQRLQVLNPCRETRAAGKKSRNPAAPKSDPTATHDVAAERDPAPPHDVTWRVGPRVQNKPVGQSPAKKKQMCSNRLMLTNIWMSNMRKATGINLLGHHSNHQTRSVSDKNRMLTAVTPAEQQVLHQPPAEGHQHQRGGSEGRGKEVADRRDDQLRPRPPERCSHTPQDSCWSVTAKFFPLWRGGQSHRPRRRRHRDQACDHVGQGGWITAPAWTCGWKPAAVDPVL